jgi:transcriptional regulator with XRE-family HTH domain
VKDLPDPWRELGEFIREQRSVARLSVRRLSDMAGISNPYLSQIERGLRKPSAEILQQIAKALRISAETLYVRAGILDPHEGEGDLSRAILGDSSLTEEQKQALLRIYLSFRRENDASGWPTLPVDAGAEAPARERVEEVGEEAGAT